MESAYWRDIGTLDAYFEANLDLKEVQPKLNLYNWDWPIRTVSYSDPPVKFVFDDDGTARRSDPVDDCRWMHHLRWLREGFRAREQYLGGRRRGAGELRHPGQLLHRAGRATCAT